jgi:hypothetical protein
MENELRSGDVPIAGAEYSEDEIEEDEVVENTSLINKKFKIKETSIVLNTGDTGMTSYVTDLINGHLECVIVKTTNPVNMKITMNSYEDIVLFEDRNVYGVRYLPLRSSAIDDIGNKFNYAPEKFALNDMIRIDIRSVQNAQINIIIRWS